MLRFILKRAFFLAWDDLLPLTLANGACLVLGLAAFAGPSTIRILAILCLGPAWAAIAERIAGRRSVRAASGTRPRPAAPRILIRGLVLSSLGLGLAAMVAGAIPFYLGLRSPGAYFAAGLLLWASLAAATALAALPSLAALAGSLRAGARRCLELSILHPWLLVSSGLAAAVALALSPIGAFLFPGPAYAMAVMDGAALIAEAELDWMREHPGARRRDAPWRELLVNEMEELSGRSYRDIVSPWRRGPLR